MCFIQVLVCVSTCCFVPDMIDQLLSSIYHDITCQECLAGANVCVVPFKCHLQQKGIARHFGTRL